MSEIGAFNFSLFSALRLTSSVRGVDAGANKLLDMDPTWCFVDVLPNSAKSKVKEFISGETKRQSLPATVSARQ